MKSRFNTILFLITLLVIGVAGNMYWYNEKHTATKKIQRDENLTYDQLIQKAFAQKSEGDLGKKEEYTHAIEFLKKAAESAPNEYLPWINIAVIARLIGDHILSESAYAKALEIAPTVDQLHLGRVEFYRYDLQKNSSVIINLYEKALHDVPDKTNIIISYSAYLYDIGRYKESLYHYRSLLRIFPENNAYQKRIFEIEKQINKME